MDEILNLIESVSEGFSTYSFISGINFISDISKCKLYLVGCLGLGLTAL